MLRSSKTLILAVFLLLTTICSAQNATSLNGEVLDASGVAVANAEVTLVMKDSSVRRTTRTDNSGQFGFPDIPPGSYEITASLQGFKEVKASGIANVGQASRITLKLQLQAGIEHVEITTEPELAATWNAWLEKSGRQTFQKLKTVHTREDYKVALDLSAFRYLSLDRAIVANRASSPMNDWLDHQKDEHVLVKILMVPDPTMLSTNKTQIQTLEINVSRMRQYLRKHKQKLPVDPLQDLIRNPDSGFRFGHTSFEFHTDSLQGLAYVGLSVWANDIPLDEIVVPVCISDSDSDSDCDDSSASSHGDPLNAIPLSSEKDMPAASIHFFDFGSERTIGVLHISGNEYLTWTVANLSSSVGKFINEILLKNFDKEVNSEALANTGYALYNLLLPPKDPFAAKARQAIENVVTNRVVFNGSKTNAPPLVVRMATYSSESVFFVPLGMAAVPLDDKKYFLGDLFRILSALPYQTYRPLDRCISRWVMVMPPVADQTPQELRTARLEFKDWTNACKGSDCIESMTSFENWIGNRSPEKQSTALLILGHYEDGSFTFDHNQFVGPSSVEKMFRLPSLAIIDACAAAAPGADQFVKTLNEAGFESIVATTTTVKPVMAGQYFNILARQLEEHKLESDYTISKAHFDAIHELEKTAPEANALPYGPKALIYSLLGNGSLRLCTIPRK